MMLAVANLGVKDAYLKLDLGLRNILLTSTSIGDLLSLGNL